MNDVVAADLGRQPALRLSWPDAIMARIEALPGPAWLAYAGAAVILGLVGEAARWLAGTVALGSIDPQYLVEGTFAPLFFGSAAALNGVARRAFERLRPALEADRMVLDEIAVDLVRTPGNVAGIAALAGFATAILSVLGDPRGYGLGPESPGLAWVAAAMFGGFSTASLFVFVVHALHQLRIVRRVHRDLVRVDLFQLDPLYSFASLTSRTGLTLIAVTVYGLVAFSLQTGALIGTGSIVDAVTVIGVLSVAVACFVLPLLGLHGRIADERDRRRAEAGAVVGRTIAEIKARSAAGDHEAIGALNNALQAATGAVAAVSRVSTWPWRPETLRGFASAIGLPVVIWVITAVLSRVIPR